MSDTLKGGITIGIDVGQRTDYTAIAVAESTGESRLPYNPLPIWHHEIRAISRFDLGIPYPEQARRVKRLVDGVIDRTGGQYPRLYVDATGIGTGFVDDLRAANVLAVIIPVYFNHGDKRIVKLHPNTKQAFLSLGKAWLVQRLQSLLQRVGIKLPTTPIMKLLADELLNYEIKISDKGDDTYGAFKVGTHDDLVTALGLSVLDDAADSRGETEAKMEPVLPGVF